jgi:hypothetical protein
MAAYTPSDDSQEEATKALQAALDRRDNGGRTTR